MRNKKWVRKVIDFIKDDLLDPFNICVFLMYVMQLSGIALAISALVYIWKQ